MLISHSSKRLGKGSSIPDMAVYSPILCETEASCRGSKTLTTLMLGVYPNDPLISRVQDHISAEKTFCHFVVIVKVIDPFQYQI